MGDSEVKVKYITSEYGDLFALQKQYGISKGPIRTPLRVSVDTIAELFQQQSPLPKIQEIINMIPEGHGAPEWSIPVELTKENFRKTYSEIAKEQDVENEKRIISEVYTTPAEDNSSLLEDEADKEEEVVPPAVDPELLETLKDEDGKEAELPEVKIEDAVPEEIAEPAKEEEKVSEPVEPETKPEKKSKSGKH